MRIANKRGFYIANNSIDALLDEYNESILDAFMFENPKEITKKRFEKYMRAIQ